jgi:hypothetical protein
MGKVRDEIDPPLANFMQQQNVFFVATAPTSRDGHINLSPKGLDTFRILDPKTVVYLDFVGSGVETIAHLKENARIVLMFCAFQGPPNVVRLHGRGHAFERSSADFPELLALFPPYEGVRAIVRVDLTRISDSCGYGVPLLKYEGERTQLRAWAQKKGPEGLKEYRERKNRYSIDGLPGLSE